MPNTRCPTSVATECSTNLGSLRVAEASRKPPDQIEPSVGGAQQQPARVRRQRAAVELGHHRAAFDPSKQARFCATLRLHRATSLNRLKSFSQNNFCLIRRPDAPILV